jgi:hypothetical protein
MTPEEKETLAKKALLGDEEPTTEIITDLGKGLTPDQKQKINDEESMQKDFKSFGFRDLDPKIFASEGLYYEDGRKTKIKPLDYEVLKYYSLINENDPDDIEEKVNEILAQGSQIILGSGSIGSYKDLSQTDKIIVLFAIRDLTMLAHHRDKKIIQKIKSPKSDEVEEIEITKDVFSYYQLKESWKKHYNPTGKNFLINHELFGTSPLTIYVPTVGVVDYITDYFKKVKSDPQNSDLVSDRDFLAKSQFLIPNWRLLDKEGKYMKNLHSEFKSFSYDKMATFVKFTDQLNIGIKPYLTVNFGSKGGEVTVPIRFPNYRSLFDFSAVSSELLED